MILLAGCSANSVEDQAKQLGAREFTVQAWTAGTQEERGQMIASFLAKYRVTDLTGKQVRGLLGPSTGYYDYDEYPAYLVGPKTVKSDYGNGYLWVFITDKSSGAVRKVILVPAVESKRA
jgi:hypothetical protein